MGAQASCMSCASQGQPSLEIEIGSKMKATPSLDRESISTESTSAEPAGVGEFAEAADVGFASVATQAFAFRKGAWEDAEYVPKRTTRDDSLGDPHRGVSVAHLSGPLMDKVRRLQREGKLSEKPSVADIEPVIIRPEGAKIVCPRDSRMGAAYVDSISDAGKATFMLSYTWRYPIEDIAETLTRLCADLGLDPSSTYVWICCFCVNQHRVKENRAAGRDVPFDAFRSAFADKVEHLDMVSMMSPWHDPYYLKRVWCIFEMYTACSLGKKLIFAMPPSAEQAFQRELLTEGGTDGLWEALKNVAIQHAEASVEKDKELIFDLIQAEDGPGFAKLNQIVARCLKSWAIGISERFVLEREAARDLPDEELAMLCHRVIGLMKSCGHQRHARHIRKIGRAAFERAGAMDSKEGWTFQQMDAMLTMQTHDIAGLHPFLERAAPVVRQWEERNGITNTGSGTMDADGVFENINGLCHGSCREMDEASKFMLALWFHYLTAWAHTAHHGYDSARSLWADWIKLGDSVGMPQNSQGALWLISVTMVKLWDPDFDDRDAALADLKRARSWVGDLDEDAQMWSPDHCTFLVCSARIKHSCGQMEAALADAQLAYEIYEKLGGVEFQHEKSATCDTCGPLMMLMGVLKYKMGDKKGAMWAFDVGVRISIELGTLEYNKHQLGLDGAEMPGILLNLCAMSNEFKLNL